MVYVRAFDENQCEYYHLSCNCTNPPCLITMYDGPDSTNEVESPMIADNLLLQAKCKRTNSLTWNVADVNTGKAWNVGSIDCTSQDA
uniref:Ricin B-type lectin domain-containing protein n=1 Tax=Syphacia muris TaxID=451379 RepID=A0A0N5ANV6_9BILA